MLIDAWLWMARMYFYLPANERRLGTEPVPHNRLVRDLAVAALCARVVYEIYRPEHDLVRRTRRRRPVGGVLDGARDAFVLRRGRRRALAGAPA